MTTRAFTLPRAPAAAVAELALPALTVTFGLQLLRLMIPTVVSVYRDRLGAPLGTVKSRIKMGMDKLKSNLREVGGAL